MYRNSFFLLTLIFSFFSWQGNSFNLTSSHTSYKNTNKINTGNISSINASNLLIVQLFTKQRYENNGHVHDSFGIDFAVGNDNALTPKDASKPMNFFENLGINHNGTILSYESREMPQVGEIFSMHSSGYQTTEYVLKIIVQGLENTVFFLEDDFTGDSIPFGVGTAAYYFSVNSINPLSLATDRFSIRVDAVVSDYIYKDGIWSPNDPSGASTTTDDIVVVNGTASFNANTNVNNLVIQSGATLEVNNVLNLSGNITNLGDLVFVSHATGQGELGEVSIGSKITGKATVQNYMKNQRSYRMVSSAVTTSSSIHDNWQEGATSNTHNPNPGFGTHITGSLIDQQNGFDKTGTGNPSMFTVNVASQQFQAIGNTDVNTLEAGKPYLLFVRGGRDIDLNNNLAAGETVLRATGSLFTGTKTKNFPTAVPGNFVMFGNPYQSTVDINSVFAGSTNLNTAHYYIYDPTLGDHGAYVTVVLATGTNSSGSSANQYLQPGQGAQVAVLDNSPTLKFEEDDKAPGYFTSTSVTNTRLITDNMLSVQLYTSENFGNGGPTHDSFAIQFSDGHDNSLTPMDAVKPMNFYENLGIDHNGTYLSIEHRKMPQPEEIFQLYTSGFQHSKYTFNMILNGLEDFPLYLEDRFLGTSTLLQTGENSYNFTVDTDNPLSITIDRFYIRTGQRLGVDGNSPLSGIRLYPNPLNTNTFYINAPQLNREQLNVRISDFAGRFIYGQILECSANTVAITLDENVATGVYLVRIGNNREAKTYRLILE